MSEKKTKMAAHDGERARRSRRVGRSENDP